MMKVHDTFRGTRGEEGFGLIASILVMTVISILGAALLTSGMSDLGASDNYRSAKQAFYAADSGVQQTLIDFVVDSAWAPTMVDASTLPIVPRPNFPATVTINSQAINLAQQGGNPVAKFYDFGPTVPLGSALYDRELFLPPIAYNQANGKGSKMWVVMPTRTDGTAGLNGNARQLIQADARVLLFRISVWDNAIFAGGGQNGNQINGNVQVRGSVHIIGDPNNPTTINWGGGAMMLNNYLGAADNDNFGADVWRLPSLPTRLIDNELVETLDAEFRMKHGNLDIGGTVTLGAPNQTGTWEKEQLDGFYMDGQVTATGSAAVHTDYSGEYDIREDIAFPSLSDQYIEPGTGQVWMTHRSYLMTNSVLLPYNKIDDSTPAFVADDGLGNRVEWDPSTGELSIDGIARVQGTLELGDKGGQSGVNRIEYTGTGTMYATDDIRIHWDVVPKGEYLSTQGNARHNLGLIADRNIRIADGPGDSWIKVFAAIYGEDQIKIKKQSRIAGSLVSSDFDLGANVPRIFQVPKLAGMLPPGMPGAEPLLYVSRVEVANWTHLR